MRKHMGKKKPLSVSSVTSPNGFMFYSALTPTSFINLFVCLRNCMSLSVSVYFESVTEYIVFDGNTHGCRVIIFFEKL